MQIVLAENEGRLTAYFNNNDGEPLVDPYGNLPSCIVSNESQEQFWSDVRRVTERLLGQGS